MLTRRSGCVYVGVMSSDVLYRLDLKVVDESCFISEPHYSTALGPVASPRYPRIYLRRYGRKENAARPRKPKNDCVMTALTACCADRWSEARNSRRGWTRRRSCVWKFYDRASCGNLADSSSIKQGPRPLNDGREWRAPVICR
jgi:hypothetical protein